MGIDPIRSRHTPAVPPALRRIEGGRRAAEPAAGTGPAADARPEETPPRVDLARARIASDYYGQAHVRERILSALLQFLDE